MSRYDKLERPTAGTPVTVMPDGGIGVPDDPIIPFIEGDGVGPEISAAARRVVDAAVEMAFKGKRKIQWLEVYGGERAVRLYGAGNTMPEDTLQAVQEYRLLLRGPMVGSGAGAPFAVLHEKLNLSAGVCPCRWLKGAPSLLKSPERVDTVVFLDNRDGLMAAHDFEAGSDEARKLIAFAREELGISFGRDTSLALLSSSIPAARGLVRSAVTYALEHRISRVTLVHDADLLAETGGVLRDAGYQLAKDEFPEQCLTESELSEKHGGKLPRGKVLLNHEPSEGLSRRITASPEHYDLLVCSGFVGRHLASAIVSQLGGLTTTPCASLGDGLGVFGTMHGTAGVHAGKDVANPGATMMAGKMLLDYIGWKKAGQLIEQAMEGAIAGKTVTLDMARKMDKAIVVKCSEFAEAIVRHMD